MAELEQYRCLGPHRQRANKWVRNRVAMDQTKMDTTQTQVRVAQLRKPGRKDEKLYHVMPNP